MQRKHSRMFRLSALAASLALVHGSALAEVSDEVAELITPASRISAGVGLVDDDNRYYGIYSGRRDSDSHGLLDLILQKRDETTGTWLKFTGRNLGLDNREARLEHNRQGDWGYFLDYSETPRYEPLNVVTRLSGIGTGVQNVTGEAVARPVELKMEREKLGGGFDKQLGHGLELQVRFSSEDKNGARFFGRQGAAAGIDFLTEPIDSTIRQWEAMLNYTGEKLQLSGGYYGTAFVNQYTSILGSGGNGGDNVLNGLPQDNYSHQLYLTGGYSFTPTTRGSFKVAYTKATQDEAFFTPPTFAGNTRTDLGGRIDTTLIQLGLSARPLPKLALNASLRHEDRDDKTPQVQYLTATATRTGFNSTHSPTITTAKLDASYQLPMGFLLAGGFETEKRKRSVPDLITIGYRKQTDEDTWRIELKRYLSETINGSIAYLHSDRSGSEYISTSGTITDLINPIHWGDRVRDKVRLMLDWVPMETLSLQLIADTATDDYRGRVLGRDGGKAEFFSLDAAYTISDDWQANAWLARDDNRATQVSQSSTPENWTARIRYVGDSAGLGVKGKPTGKLEVGAEAQYVVDRTEYRLEASTGSLPDINNRLKVFKLFANYAVQKNAGVRLDWVHERRNTDDWTFSNAAFYSGGTVVSMTPNETVNFLGISGYYSFR